MTYTAPVVIDLPGEGVHRAIYSAALGMIRFSRRHGKTRRAIEETATYAVRDLNGLGTELTRVDGDRRAVYRVIEGACSCPAGVARRLCRHVAAVKVIREMGVGW